MNDPVSTEHVTKHGVRVEVGQIWRDLDPRMGHRLRKVAEVKDGKARMVLDGNPKFASWVSISRMHKHSTGWELVP